jgi:RNA polymerase sigma factor (sigma-70 family)
VATRLGYNALRTRRRSSARDAVWQALNTHCESPAEEQAIHAEEQSQVRQALASLSARDAQLLVLRHSGLSYQECAEVLEVAVTSIGTLLARAERAFEKRYVALDRGKEHGHGTSG